MRFPHCSGICVISWFAGNPARAPELRAANEAFANALRVEGGAGKIGSDQGVFTPDHLLSSVRQLDPSLRKGTFARGDALMQDLGDAGKAVLGNKVPDSGTPFENRHHGGAGSRRPLCHESRRCCWRRWGRYGASWGPIAVPASIRWRGYSLNVDRLPSL